ncbi:hypothetical protein BGX29_007536, partial [Mortierella sp. GBA35]
MKSPISLAIASIATAVLLFSSIGSVSEAAPISHDGASGQTGVILNATDFCIFLPPEYGGDIAENEDRA